MIFVSNLLFAIALTQSLAKEEMTVDECHELWDRGGINMKTMFNISLCSDLQSMFNKYNYRCKNLNYP